MNPSAVNRRNQLFVVVAVVVVFSFFVPACITMHSGPCSPVLPGFVVNKGKVGFGLLII